ncbi:retrotransposon protein, putative, ty1-copia subclass [Tanacetum coccineum]
MARKPFPHQVERAKALETAARILNMVPTKKVDRKPYEIWHRKAPKLSYLRVWGCEALVKRDTPEKLDSRSINFMVQEASGSHRLLEMSRSDKGLEFIQEEDTKPSENTSKAHNKYELGDLDELPNYKAAFADPESDKWLEAMNTEMQSMRDNQVWYLVDLPYNGRTVRCKWLFKKKIIMDGNDLGEAAYILGIKIICDRSKRLIALSQSAYPKEILDGKLQEEGVYSNDRKA